MIADPTDARAAFLAGIKDGRRGALSPAPHAQVARAEYCRGYAEGFRDAQSNTPCQDADRARYAAIREFRAACERIGAQPNDLEVMNAAIEVANKRLTLAEAVIEFLAQRTREERAIAAALVVAAEAVDQHAEREGYNDEGCGYDRWRETAISDLADAIRDGALETLEDFVTVYDEAAEIAEAREDAAIARAEAFRDGW